MRWLSLAGLPIPAFPIHSFPVHSFSRGDPASCTVRNQTPDNGSWEKKCIPTILNTMSLKRDQQYPYNGVEGRKCEYWRPPSQCLMCACVQVCVSRGQLWLWCLRHFPSCGRNRLCCRLGTHQANQAGCKASPGICLPLSPQSCQCMLPSLVCLFVF